MKTEPKKKHIFVATPLITSEVTAFHMEGLDEIYRRPPQGVTFTRRHTFPRDVIRARSRLLRKFIEDKESTHLLWVDGDNKPTPETIRGMLECRKDIIGAPYPQREIHRQLRPGDMNSAMRYSIIPKPMSSMQGSCIEIIGMGFGCMLITREVAEKLVVDHVWKISKEQMQVVFDLPDSPAKAALLKQLNNTFIDDFPGENNALTTAVFSLVNSFGTQDLDPKCPLVMLGEDYSFCARARASGYGVYCYVGGGAPIEHDGMVRFTGNIDDVIRSIANIPGPVVPEQDALEGHSDK